VPEPAAEPEPEPAPVPAPDPAPDPAPLLDPELTPAPPICPDVLPALLVPLAGKITVVPLELWPLPEPDVMSTAPLDVAPLDTVDDPVAAFTPAEPDALGEPDWAPHADTRASCAIGQSNLRKVIVTFLA
jgi:hypothetical protein